MRDLTPNYNYARLIKEEKDHYSKIEVTDKLTEGGRHASSSWNYYWTRVAAEIRSSPFADLPAHLERQYGRSVRPLRILSLGSGYCGHELAMAQRLRCAYEITCTDINETLFTEARKRAQALGLFLRFQVEDLNFIRIAPGSYDMIFAHAVLHHVINLERLFDQIAMGLNVGGILHLVEVVGKNRRLLWEENERFANAILDALPHELTEGAKLQGPPMEEGMEGVRQEEILPILRERFEPLYEYLHGAFMRYVCTDERLARHLNPEHEVGRRYLDLLIDIDWSAIRNGILRPLEIWGVYRLQPTPASRSPMKSPFTRKVTSAMEGILEGVPALTECRQQVGDIQQKLVQLQQSLEASYLDPNIRPRMLNETTAASQAAQLLLRHKYRELLYNHLPLPELADTEFRCLSQNGEDGILLYIFTILGTTNKRTVEICAGDAIECNSANLIINHGWYGLLFDGDERNISRAKDFYSKCQDTFSSPPTLVASWITAENVNSLIVDNGFAGDVDLLSLDIDGMDYWVWRAIQCISPRVIILEFNPIWGPDRAVSVPYQADFRIDNSRRPYYTGASLSAFVKLGREKGFRFVGTQRLGFNALFVRSGVGEDFLPEISPQLCFERHPVLKAWGLHWIPNVSERPEWKNIVEV